MKLLHFIYQMMSPHNQIRSCSLSWWNPFPTSGEQSQSLGKYFTALYASYLQWLFRDTFIISFKKFHFNRPIQKQINYEYLQIEYTCITTIQIKIRNVTTTSEASLCLFPVTILIQITMILISITTDQLMYFWLL